MTNDDLPGNKLRCRFCLAEEVNEVFPTFRIASSQNMLISHMALACTGVAISCHDKLPQYSCDKCIEVLDIAYACWKRCRQSWGNFIRDASLSPEGVEDYRCRICLESEVDELVSLFCICDEQSMIISEILKRFAGLSVSEKDEFPQYICGVCLEQLNTGFSFRLLARRSYETLRNQLEGIKDDTNTINDKSPTSNDLVHQDEAEITVFSNVFTENQDPLMIEPVVNSTNPTHQPMSIPSSPLKVPQEKSQQNIPTKNKILQPTKKPDQEGTVNRDILLISSNSPSVGQKSLKKAYFSSPDEFKKLTARILNKSEHRIIPKHTETIASKTSATNDLNNTTRRTVEPIIKPVLKQRATTTAPNPVPNDVYVTKSFGRQQTAKSLITDGVQSVSISSLVPASFVIKSRRRCTIAQSLATVDESAEEYEMKNPTFSWAQIKEFNCKVCNCKYLSSELKDTCTICSLPFDNFLPNNLQRHNNQLEYVEAYCCSKCTFFSISLVSFTTHLEIHKSCPTEEFDRPILTDITERDEPKRKCSRKTGPRTARFSAAQPIQRRSLVKSATPAAAMKAFAKPPVNQSVPKNHMFKSLIFSKKRSKITSAVVEQLRRTPKRARSPKANSTITISDSDDEETEQYHETTMDDGDHNAEMDTVVTEETAQIEYKLESVESELGIYYRNSSDEEFAGFIDEGTDTNQQDARSSPAIDANLFDILHRSSDYFVLFLKGALCCGCLQLFETRKMLRMHRAKDHPRRQHSAIPEMCDVCRVVPSNASRHHMLNAKPIFYFCKLCARVLIDVVDYESHRKIEHPLKRPRIEEARTDLLVRKRDAEALLRVIDNPTHCADPFKSIENKAIFHPLKETDNYKLLFIQGHLCCGCQHWFSTCDALLAHCGETHGHGCDSDEYRCDLCKTDCKSQSRLMRHQLQRSRRLHYYCKLCHAVLLHHADDYGAHRAIAHNYQLKPTNVREGKALEMLVCKEL